MGIYAFVHTLSDENIQKLLAYPPLLWKLATPEDPDAYEQACAERSSFFRRIFKRGGGNATQPPEFTLADGENADLDLEKSWHGLHYLLMKTAWKGDPPLDFLLRGGVDVRDIDIGLGPARVFSSNETRRIHAALTPIESELLKSRFDPAKMRKLNIYPDVWRSAPEADIFGWCEDSFSELKNFIEQAVVRNFGLVIYRR